MDILHNYTSSHLVSYYEYLGRVVSYTYNRAVQAKLFSVVLPTDQAQ